MHIDALGQLAGELAGQRIDEVKVLGFKDRTDALALGLGILCPKIALRVIRLVFVRVHGAFLDRDRENAVRLRSDEARRGDLFFIGY